MGIKKKYDTHPTLVDNQSIEGCLKKWTMFTNVLSPINAIYIFIYLFFGILASEATLKKNGQNKIIKKII
jgi:hypothetical protein